MSAFDPWAVLGLEPGARQSRIDAAFEEARARFTAADDAPALARLEASYAMASDSRWRARDRLFGPAPFDDLADVAEALRALPRTPAGVALWLEMIRAG